MLITTIFLKEYLIIISIGSNGVQQQCSRNGAPKEEQLRSSKRGVVTELQKRSRNGTPKEEQKQCTANHFVRCTSIASPQDTAEPPFFENRSSVFELRDMINGSPFLLCSLYFSCWDSTFYMRVIIKKNNSGSRYNSKNS